MAFSSSKGVRGGLIMDCGANDEEHHHCYAVRLADGSAKLEAASIATDMECPVAAEIPSTMIIEASIKVDQAIIEKHGGLKHGLKLEFHIGRKHATEMSGADRVLLGCQKLFFGGPQDKGYRIKLLVPSIRTDMIKLATLMIRRQTGEEMRYLSVLLMPDGQYRWYYYLEDVLVSREL